MLLNLFARTSSALKLIVVSTALFTITSCAKHKPKPLTPISQMRKKASKSTPVSVAARELSSGDTQHYFDKNIQKEGFRTVQLTIVNDSDSPYVLEGKNIEMSLEAPDLVAKRLHFNTARRVLTWAIPSIIAWPLLIVATMDGLQSSSANKNIDYDLRSRAIDNKDVVVVPPNSTINKVMFVRSENLNHDFGVTLSHKFAPEPLHFSLGI